jgi:short-subunit dehydrogenase
VGDKPLKAIVIGASSGIGRAVAKALAARGDTVAVTARRVNCLEALNRDTGGKLLVRGMDLCLPEEAAAVFEELVRDMGGADLVVVNSGVNRPNFDLGWPEEIETVRVNVVGFMAIADAAGRYFLARGKGHLAAVSSIAGLRGSGRSPAYAASKSFMSVYLDGLRQRFSRTSIAVTDIRPGFVDTAMLEGRRNLFWMASPERAASQILEALDKKKRVAYVTRRWAIAAFLLRRIPNRLYDWGFWKVIEADRAEKVRGT